MDFAWDAAKAAGNVRKHHVAFEEAQTVFDDPLAVIFEDEEHSETEARRFIIGHSPKNRLLLVCFTERRDGIRLISARPATHVERQDYEDNRHI
jgi:hypothetical protein